MRFLLGLCLLLIVFSFAEGQRHRRPRGHFRGYSNEYDEYPMQPVGDERPSVGNPRHGRPPRRNPIAPDERPPEGHRRRPHPPKGLPMRPDERPPMRPTVRPPKPSGCVNLFFACTNAQNRFLCEMDASQCTL